MQKELLPLAEQYAKQNKRQSLWRRIVRVMACVVVFCTTYALILPAITMERQLCGLEEHTHSDSCYVKMTTQQVTRLTCSYETLEVHEHTEECRDADQELICGYADFMVHEHNAFCFDGNGALVCAIPEIKEHEHAEECYRKETQDHVHDDFCYTIERGELICESEEFEGHTHTGDCVVLGDLVCGLEESEGHTHGADCSETVLACDLTVEPHIHAEECWTELVCELPEDETHAHSEACSGSVLVCDLTEQPHVHGDPCYQTNSLCDLPEMAAHVHGDGCYASVSVCGQEENEGHAHADTCYEQIQVLICEPEETEPAETSVPELICEEEEIKLHTHDEDDCYETYLDENEEEQKRLVCEETVVEEHVHGEGCFVTEEVPLANVEELTCGQEEAESHDHGETCYDETGTLTCTLQTDAHTHTDRCYGTWVLICGKEEHTHGEECGIYFCGMEGHSHSEECMDEAGNLFCTMDEHIHTTACSALTEEEWSQIHLVIEMIDGIPSDEEIYAKIEEFEAVEDYDGEDAWLGEVYQQVSEVYHAFYAPLSEEQKACITNADKLLQLEYIWSASTFAVQAYELPKNLTVPVSYVNRRGSGNPRTDVWQGYVFSKSYVNGQSDGYFLKFVTATDVNGAYPYYRCHVIAKDNSTGRLYIKDVITSSQLNTIVTNSTERELVNYLQGMEGFFLFSNTKAFEGGSKEDYYNTVGTTVETSFNWEQFNTTAAASTSSEYHILDQEYFGTINLNVESAALESVEGEHVNATVKLFNYDASINNSGDGDYWRMSRAGYLFYQSDNVKDGEHGHITNPKEDTVDGIGGRDASKTGGEGIGVPGDYDNPLMSATLTEDGYPQASKGTFARYFDNTYLEATMSGGGGLFRQDSKGYWYYDSKDTAASYNASTNRFDLYNNPVSPSYLVTVYGRRMAGEKGADQLTRVNLGNFLPFNEINDDTVRQAEPEIYYGQKSYNITTDNLLLDEKTYLALKVPTDLWFGMTVDNEFYMPKDGKMNGEDMVFEFHGDDDVFVYLGVWNEETKAYDYKLVLDIGGTHAARSGTINFATGAVQDFPAALTEGVENTSARSRTLKQIFGLSGNTFEDYTKLSMKFYYMERGGMISYCSLRFNMPVLAENSLSVTKELTGTADAEMLGNPDFRFQVLHANEDGSKTEEPFIGEGVPYTIYDVATNIKVGTGTTGANGVFTIKAGQRAEFEGIVENSGKYYVRELLDTDYFEQYGEIRVDGEVVSAADVSTSFKGVHSPVKDASSGTTFFTFNNHVDVTKLGYLTVTKNVPGINVDQQFKMIVKLNDVLLPAGTEYILYDTDAFLNGGQKNEVGRGTVSAEEPGIILVKDGETAWIDAILPGTTFRVSEDSGSAKGYYVSYNPFLGDQWMDEPTANGIGGVVPVKVDENAHVCVEVKNTPAQGSFEIPVTKIIPNKSYDPNTAHIYNFSLELVYISSSTKNYTASELGKEHKDEITITVDGIDETTGKAKISGENKFQLSYVASDFQWTDTYLTYKITENKPDEQKSTHDSTVYYATVKVTKSGRELTTSWYALTKDEPTPDGTAVSQITFTNTLLGDLSLQKIVSGGAGAQESGSFDFTIRVDMSAAGMQGKTLQVVKNGQSAGTVTANADGIATLNLTGVKHNDLIALNGIPLGSTWTITETNAAGYIVSWTKNGTSGTGNVAAGDVLGGGMEVVFTNTVGYELPQTGGAGTTSYTMGGLLLMMAAAILLYSHIFKRRKEEMSSF